MSGVRPGAARVLRLVEALMRSGGWSRLHPLLVEAQRRPKGLGPMAIAHLQSRLTAGCARLLLADGWRAQVSLTDDGPLRGPVWRRLAGTGLRFGPATWTLLEWLSTQPVGKPRRALLLADVQPGDALLAALATRALVALNLPVPAALSAVPLVQLVEPHAPPEALTFDPWLDGDGLTLTTALQPFLADCWVELEVRKRGLAAADALHTLGAAQATVLSAWFDAIERRGRRDLAGFCVEAARRLLAPGPTAEWWVEHLEGGRIADRVRGRGGAARFLQALARPARWHAEHRAAHFIDDGYDAAQALVSAWADLGAEGFQRAAALADALTAVTALGGDP